MMSKTMLAVAAATLMTFPAAHAADYKIDTEGMHASIEFKVKHLGYSWVVGRFDKFDGAFSYDAKHPEQAKVSVTIDTTSLNSNHAERDKHLKGSKFIDAATYPQATFVSDRITVEDDGEMDIHGTLTLHGVSKPIVIEAEKIGEGKDPWGGYRAGFIGETEFALKDFGIDTDLGPASRMVELELIVEGIRQ